jgi:hypothetical protein
MRLKLYKFINFNNKKFSLKFFNQSLPLIYILFNFLYRMIVVNTKENDSEIKQFHNSGFAKINISFKEEIEEYKDKFFLKNNDPRENKKSVILELNDDDKKNFSIKIKQKLSPLLDKLKNYFNCDVIISSIRATRNYNHKDALNLEEEHYSNHFHQDSYLITYSKIFINLMDINENDGPLEIIPRENKNSFIKSFNYKHRRNYNLHGDKSLIKKNIGKLGDCCLFSSPQIFHRAGVPKNYRDNMQIILVTVPRYCSDGLDKIDHIGLFENRESHFFKFTKPYSITKVIRLFFTIFKYKFNG